mmetsp:Transcript_27988/g.43508  ORF Transcript_27988/g.43508 Transcript_27988/m.43508 type:complete len:176 (+) Transcript_27988:109-636(+)|eukprot:CAMPEP_0196801780 /NCGR_PEP_ID=MMETSP1362-20130617/1560_1 /TAXON_ID=163516 /ORGANISM="Leptocylindrus danicus, Strain CCMP1856" /LENGTH=175 /DNA_ID=CAMNT_0042172901 /DNA_START=91 /DNA_END=618 /DNA_ORIENTATION=+
MSGASSITGRMRLMKFLMAPKKKIKPQQREAEKKTRWNILRGDLVQVIRRGHDEFGKQGTVLHVNRKSDRVTIKGVNLGKMYLKGDPQQGIKGSTIMKERSMHYSNVNLVDPVTGLPTRVSRKYLEDGGKVRVSKRSGAIIPRPEILSIRKRPVSQHVGDKDTVDADAWEATYQG